MEEKKFKVVAPFNPTGDQPQAIENLAILLKEMYPKMHDGEIPT